MPPVNAGTCPQRPAQTIDNDRINKFFNLCQTALLQQFQTVQCKKYLAAMQH
jgi:hypothetical protein